MAFERYADDAVVHCVTERQARNLVVAIGDRMERGRSAAASRQDEGGVLPRRRTGDSIVSSRASRSRGSPFVPAARGPSTERMFVSFQPAISKDARTRSAVRSADGGCTAGSAHPRRDRPTDQPCRARMDAVLRGFLPLRAESAPIAHQCLRDALDPQQVQTAAPYQESHGMLATHHQPASPALRPLGMGARFLVDRMTRAR